MNRWIRKSLLLAGTLSIAIAAQAGDQGAMLGDTCAGCHGLRGASAGETMPIIAGLSREFIVTAMKEFRDGSRASTVMGRIAKGYKDHQIEAMAGYFARQPWAPASQKVDLAVLKRGKQLHFKRCEACHRDNGASMALDMQPLAGQWAGYLQIYMDTCRDPKWLTRHPDAMTVLCNDLDARDVAALVQFYASQK